MAITSAIMTKVTLQWPFHLPLGNNISHHTCCNKLKNIMWLNILHIKLAIPSAKHYMAITSAIKQTYIRQ